MESDSDLAMIFSLSTFLTGKEGSLLGHLLVCVFHIFNVGVNLV